MELSIETFSTLIKVVFILERPEKEKTWEMRLFFINNRNFYNRASQQGRNESEEKDDGHGLEHENKIWEIILINLMSFVFHFFEKL